MIALCHTASCFHLVGFFDTVPILTARPDYTTKARKIRRLYTNSYNKEEAINELKEFVHGLPDKGYRNSVYTPNDIG